METEIEQLKWLKQCVRDGRMSGGMAAELEEKLEEIRSAVADLERRLAEAERDSARLDWLISASHEGESDYLSDALWDDASKFYFDDKSTAECVRAAIDAAKGGER